MTFDEWWSDHKDDVFRHEASARELWEAAQAAMGIGSCVTCEHWGAYETAELGVVDGVGLCKGLMVGLLTGKDSGAGCRGYKKRLTNHKNLRDS